MNNPLLNFDQLPFFQSIKAEHVLPALETVLKESRAHIKTLGSLEVANWQNFADKIEDINERIGRVWSPVGHLNGVRDSSELRDAYQQGIRLLTEYKILTYSSNLKLLNKALNSINYQLLRRKLLITAY